MTTFFGTEINLSAEQKEKIEKYGGWGNVTLKYVCAKTKWVSHERSIEDIESTLMSLL